MTAKRVIAVAVALVAGACPSGAVQQVKSLYTAIDLKACQTLSPGAGESAREAHVCEGLPGYPIYLAEDGQKTYFSTGPNPAETRAARQTLDVPNTLFEGANSRAAVEWRFIIRSGATLPYAVIMRYFTQGNAGPGQTLVVLRVTPTETCHVAYIDAVTQKDAITLARDIADEKARNFDCDSSAKPIVISGGVAPPD